MIKKLSLVSGLALAILGVSGVANANSDGFYAGLGIGASSFFDRHSTSVPAIPFNSSADLGKIGFIGGGLLGYNWDFPSRFNFGMEVFLNGTTAKASLNDGVDTYTAKSRYNYGFRILPGYKWNCDTVSYVILGVANGNFNTSYTDNLRNRSGSTNFNRTGWQVGLGSATNVWCNKLFLRGDIIYTGYGTRNVNGTYIGEPATFGHRLSTLDAMISLVYKFS